MKRARVMQGVGANRACAWVAECENVPIVMTLAGHGQRSNSDYLGFIN